MSISIIFFKKACLVNYCSMFFKDPQLDRIFIFIFLFLSFSGAKWTYTGKSDSSLFFCQSLTFATLANTEQNPEVHLA